jgi:hypothetical protein
MNNLFEVSERELLASLTASFQSEDVEPELECASMDKPLDERNVGFQLLLKMGWQAGHPLGVRGHGLDLSRLLTT